MFPREPRHLLALAGGRRRILIGGGHQIPNVEVDMTVGCPVDIDVHHHPPRRRVIGSSLGGSYVVVGQGQRSPLGIRVLASLIRLPDQTYIRVPSLERKVSDTKKMQAEIALGIADQFAPRLSLFTNVAK